MTDSRAPLAMPLSGETVQQWDRRRRARMAMPADLDPLAGTIVIAHETVQVDTDARGRRHATPRTVDYDVLADKRTMRPVAYRYANGTIEHIGGASGPNTQVIATHSVPRPKPSDPGAKSHDKIVHRITVEPTRETIIDEDGTERIVVGRRPGGY
jgi:hypothetical protein